MCDKVCCLIFSQDDRDVGQVRPDDGKDKEGVVKQSIIYRRSKKIRLIKHILLKKVFANIAKYCFSCCCHIVVVTTSTEVGL